MSDTFHGTCQMADFSNYDHDWLSVQNSNAFVLFHLALTGVRVKVTCSTVKRCKTVIEWGQCVFQDEDVAETEKMWGGEQLNFDW